MMRLLSILFILLSSSFNVYAQLPQVSAGSIERLTSFPSAFVPPRNIDIWLPAGYDKQQRYAVLYMHDGQMLFDATTSWNKQEWQIDEVASRLIKAGKTQPFIVVGIDNAGENRHSEYFPQQPFENLSQAQQTALYQLQRTKNQALFSQQVYSDRYLKFLVTELKPYIDSHYSVYTDAAHTFVMGSSMGGLISLYAISEYPHIFGGAACLSTHWPGTFEQQNNPIPPAFFNYMQQKLPDPSTHKLYFDHGTATLDAWYPQLQAQADKIIKAKGYTSQNWQSLTFEGAEHSEHAWAARLDIPLIFLLALK
ncbi:alpha/beta hydrolase [Shewanella cutis]|uniref:Esterase n=1 Tax=Shewanella cutis TaxID=2766780 RepID=A0ABS9R354_9GAMM|nr:esterase [Shewanella sp. PS-2]